MTEKLRSLDLKLWWFVTLRPYRFLYYAVAGLLY